MKVRFLQMQTGWRVKNLDRSEKFYQQLGFQTVYRNDPIHLVMSKDNVTLHLSTLEQGGGGCQIMVDNVDALYEALKTKIVKHLDSEVGDREWGCRDFSIEDPDGNIITFSQTLESPTTA